MSATVLEPRPAAGARPAGPRLTAWAALVAAALLGLNTVLTAPAPPTGAHGWRWAAVGCAVALGGWNLAAAARAYAAYGLVTVIGFLHGWLFFAFSFPAAEMTYRYEQLQMELWQAPTNSPLVLRSVLLVTLFQVLLFAALGRRIDDRLHVRLLAGSRSSGPNPRLALLVLLLFVPFVLARGAVFASLGLQGVASTAVRRVDFLSDGAGGVNLLLWLPNTLFPVFGVSLACLAIKYAVPHPSRAGRRLYLLALLGCVAGVAVSGGRAEMVFVTVAVLVSMYVEGYRSVRLLAPLITPIAAIGLLMFLLAQARNGATNALSEVAGNPHELNYYLSGDVTQVLGLGRFDAVTMILDQHDPAAGLGSRSYLYALLGALNFTFLPHLLRGEALPVWHVSESVLGPWIYGFDKASALPAAPGELYLSYGVAGIVAGALLLGWAGRLLLLAVRRLPGPVEVAWLLAVWTVARALTDSSYVIATYAMRTWPFMLALAIVVLRTAGTRPLPAEEKQSPGRNTRMG